MTVSGVIREIAFVREQANDESIMTSDRLFAALVERQAQFAFRVAYAVVRNRQDAEDAVQEAFLKLYRSGQWRQMNDERAFLARVLWRVAIRYRSRGNCAEVGDYPALDAGPERTAIASQGAAIVQRLIDALPEDLRQPLVLSGIEELDSRQIAEILNTTESAVRGRIARARQILKRKMEGRYGL